MNILYLTQFFSSTRGGGEVVFYFWARELSRRGNRIFVLRHKMPREPLVSMKDEVKVVEVSPAIRYQGGLPSSLGENLGYFLNAIRVGKKIVRKQKIDVIHCNNYTPIVAGSFVARSTNIPFIVTIHDVFSLAGPEYWKLWASQFGVSPLSSIIGPLFERVTLKAPANVIHTVSQRSRKDLIECGVKRPIVVIPNGLDLSLYPDSEGNPSFSTHHVVFIGRLVFYKNLEVLIRAFQKVSRVIPDAKLVIVGDGPMRKTWETYVARLNLADNVEFKGFVSYREKVRILNDSVALVFPSLLEGFGLVILEAFACKKPVIVSDVEPLTELVVDGYNGYLVNPVDSDEWSEKIISLMQNPEMAMEMGLRGRELTEKQYTTERVVDRLERLYQIIATD